MLPTQALTARFDLDTSSDAGQDGRKQGSYGKVSTLVSGASRQGFRIGGLRLMIPYEDGSELSEMSPIHRLSNAPDWFCGMANLQGKLTPVFDLARYVGVEHDRGAKRMLLVLAHGPDAAGVMVDGLPERLRLSDEDERADPDVAPKRLSPHLRSARYIGEQLWFDLDTRSLLDAIEHSIGVPQ
jgi:twitching motility protein PilI